MVKKLASFILVLFFGASLFSQGLELDLGDNNDYSGFKLYDNHLKDYKVFINGENHLFVKSNAELQLKMMKYLHKEAGVKNLLLELGWSRGYIITQYIQTGDTTLLPAIKAFSWDAYAELVEGLKEYNDSLPSQEKIKVTGIDVERFNSMALKALTTIFPDVSKAHDSIAVHVESVFSAISYLEKVNTWDLEDANEFNTELWFKKPYVSIENTVDYFVTNATKHKNHYLEYISPSDTSTFLKIVQQLRDSKEYMMYETTASIQAHIYRERYMFDQFEELYRSDTTQKFFMEFGRCHSVKKVQEEACTWHNFNSITNRINTSDDLGLKGKVLSTGIFYPREGKLGVNLDDESKSRLKEIYVNESKKDTLTLWNVKEDIAFKELHDFIIINYKSLSTESESELTNMSYDSDVKGFISFKAGYINVNNPGLNGFLSDSAFGSYDRKYFQGFDVGVFKNNGLYFNIDFISPLAKTVRSRDNKIKVNTYYLNANLGFDLLKNEAVSLIPYGGIGYHRTKLKYEIAGLSSYFGSTSRGTIKGNNWSYRIGTKLNFDLDGFVIGFDAGYLKDLRKTKWKEQKGTIDLKRNNVSEGFFLGSFVGFSF